MFSGVTREEASAPAGTFALSRRESHRQKAGPKGAPLHHNAPNEKGRPAAPLSLLSPPRGAAWEMRKLLAELDVLEVEFDRRRAAEDGDRDLEPCPLLIHFLDQAVE